MDNQYQQWYLYIIISWLDWSDRELELIMYLFTWLLALLQHTYSVTQLLVV